MLCQRGMQSKVLKDLWKADSPQFSSATGRVRVLLQRPAFLCRLLSTINIRLVNMLIIILARRSNLAKFRRDARIISSWSPQLATHRASALVQQARADRLSHRKISRRSSYDLILRATASLVHRNAVVLRAPLRRLEKNASQTVGMRLPFN